MTVEFRRPVSQTRDDHDDLVEALSLQVAQLTYALNSRAVIEQAKGAISVRSNVPVDIAFELLRGQARQSRRKIHEVAAEVIANGGRLHPSA
jgi:AmiR/NasT family two-component response regulator